MSDRFFVSTRKGLFNVVRDAGGSWNIEHVSFLGDSVSLSLFDSSSQTLYAALGLGHYGVKLRRSTDFGKTWDELSAPAFPPKPDDIEEKLADGRPWPWRVEQIWALEVGRPGELWCGTIGGGLFHSKDAGRTWALVESLWGHPKRKEWFGGGADLPGIHSICFHPDDRDDLLIGVSCGGAWRSTDGGASWKLTARGMIADFMPPDRADDEAIQDPHRIVRSPTRPERLWCQHHNGVFRSDDSGASWVRITDIEPSTFGFAVAVHPHDPDTAWLVPGVKDETRVPADGRVVVTRTRDGGQSWEILRDGLPQEHAYDLTYRHALDVDATGNRLAFGSTTGSLWISENGGEHFSCISTHLPPIYAVHFG